MTTLRGATIAAIGLLLTAVLAGCGGSGGSTGTHSDGASTPPGPTVTMHDFAFHPASLTIKPGTKVTFIQEDSGVEHNATATGTNAFRTPSLSDGQRYTVTFTKPGTYNYICTIHSYMHGTIVVT